MKTIERIAAKLKLLQHLQSNHNVNREIIAAAKTKLGSDLSDALDGSLADELFEQLREKTARLANGDFQLGDRVAWRFGNEPREDEVVSANASTVVVKFEGGRTYAMNKHEATSAELSNLKELADACLAAQGISGGPVNIPAGWPVAGLKPDNYPSIDVDA